MKVGMIIVNYNTFKETIELINNVKDYKIIDYIVIVDNNSTNSSVEQIKNYENNKIKLISLNENKGYGAAINLASKEIIKKLGNSKIIISNSDVIISSEEDIVSLLKLFKNNVVVVGPCIKELGGLNRGWKIPTPFQDIIMNIPYFGKKNIRKYLYYENEHYNSDFCFVDVVSGCFFLIDSKHLENIGFFDEKIFLFYEENIIGKKTKLLNKDIVVANNIFVNHVHSVSIDKKFRKSQKLKILKKSQYYFQSNYNNANFIERLLLKLTATGTIFLFKLVER